MKKLNKILTFLFGIYLFSLLSFSYFPNAHTCNSCRSDSACSPSKQTTDKNATNINDTHNCLLCVLISTAHKIISTDFITFESNQTSVHTGSIYNIIFVPNTVNNNLKVRAPPFFS